jgi:hypothetical protein
MTDYDYYRTRFYNVDGKPAMATALVAMKLVDGHFEVVVPSAVRAEGVEISEAEFDALVKNSGCQGGA